MKRKPQILTFLLFLLAGYAVSGYGAARLPNRLDLTVDPVSEFIRPDGPDSLSSVTYVSNNVYWTATDWNPQIWEMRLVEDDNGIPNSCVFSPLAKPKGAEDIEGMAFDPRNGKLWLADEFHGTVKQCDPRTGETLCAAKIHENIKKFRRNTGLESLTVSPDGLTMWTCTEDAIYGDGPRSNREKGSDIRLSRMVRTPNDDEWRADGQWVYRTDTIAGKAWISKEGFDVSRSGVSALCMPDADILLVLEREFSVVMFPRLRCRIYAVNLTKATDVSGIPSLENSKSFIRAEKKLLYEATGFSMYEGIACSSGKNGTFRLTLVSDGDVTALRSVLVLELKRSSNR